MDLPKLLREISDLVHQERYDEAATACRQLIAMSPYSEYARAALGDIYRAQDRLAEAIEVYREALALKPKRPAEIQRKLDETDQPAGAPESRGSRTGRPSQLQIPLPPITVAPPDADAALRLPPRTPTPSPAPPPSTAPATDAAPPPAAAVVATVAAAMAAAVAPTPTAEAEVPTLTYGAGTPQPRSEPAGDDEPAGIFGLDFLTPARLRWLLAFAVLVLLLSVLISVAPWKHRPRFSKKDQPIPLESSRPVLPRVLPDFPRGTTLPPVPRLQKVGAAANR